MPFFRIILNYMYMIDKNDQKAGDAANLLI